jgi:hypothetical protein
MRFAVRIGLHWIVLTILGTVGNSRKVVKKKGSFFGLGRRVAGEKLGEMDGNKGVEKKGSVFELARKIVEEKEGD